MTTTSEPNRIARFFSSKTFSSLSMNDWFRRHVAPHLAREAQVPERTNPKRNANQIHLESRFAVSFFVDLPSWSFSNFCQKRQRCAKQNNFGSVALADLDDVRVTVGRRHTVWYMPALVLVPVPYQCGTVG